MTNFPKNASNIIQGGRSALLAPTWLRHCPTPRMGQPLSQKGLTPFRKEGYLFPFINGVNPIFERG